MNKVVLYRNYILPLMNIIGNELIDLFRKTNSRTGFIPSTPASGRKYYTEFEYFYHRYGIDSDLYFKSDEEWIPDLIKSLLDYDALRLSTERIYKCHTHAAGKYDEYLDPIRRPRRWIRIFMI